MNKFADIVLPTPLDKTFHYEIPERLSGEVKRGARVLVPFGFKPLVGYVLGTMDAAQVEKTKPIIEVIDNEPVITEELFALAKWLTEKYVCSLGEALATIAPPALRPYKRESTKRAEEYYAPPLKTEKPELTVRQNESVRQILEKIETGENASFLLHGVTSSGKTEVYLAAIESALNKGKSAIFLLPEISLTPQFISIMRHRFPGVVGVWHSRLTLGEKYITWEAAMSGKVKIMLGARSAIFAPFKKLGLIIVDEEHEQSYKQDQKPTYTTRDVALARQRFSGGVAVLGSATPSLETFHLAESGGIKLLELPERIDELAFPPVTLIDMKKEPPRSRIISRRLAEALTKTLAKREQAIIFLNRRGFAPSVMCQGCGKVWECPNCSVSLVYHRPDNLECHYCGHKQPYPGVCPQCQSSDISIFGIGTQKVEEELKKQFPQARVYRMDRDSATKKGAYKKAYEDFKDENCDILLGTQMVAKGFDFPKVTLVGVIDADTQLYLPEFRSAERTFQLMTQVAGRSGRSRLGGEVIIQTKHPEHYALQAAGVHDYNKFYRQEIEYRRQMNYPPFASLINLLIRGKNESKAEEAAKKINSFINEWKGRTGISFAVLGPVPASRYKLSSMFRWQILLKGGMDNLLQVCSEIRKFQVPPGILLTVDVDPQDIL